MAGLFPVNSGQSSDLLLASSSATLDAREPEPARRRQSIDALQHGQLSRPTRPEWQKFVEGSLSSKRLFAIGQVARSEPG